MNPHVARLAARIPPPAGTQPKDWGPVETQLGTTLPEDYKELVDTYGGGLFDDAIWLLEPGCANKYYDVLTENEGRMEMLRRLWERSAPKPPELEEAGSRVITWALTENGENLHWLVRPGQKPEEWTVMISEGRGPEWERYPMPCAQFLESILLTGDVESDIFYDLPADTHEFRSSASFL